MKSSHIGVFAIILVMIAVTAAGCSGNSQPASSASGTVSTTAASAQAGSSAETGVSGSQILGGLNYEWVEYKITSNAGGEKVSMYFKYNQKTGKCSMRIEGMEDVNGLISNMDCSSAGSSSSASDPNDIGSDIKLTKVATETITVPAGTFTTDKFMVSSGGVTTNYWIASGKPIVKMEGGSAEGTVTTELSGWG